MGYNTRAKTVSEKIVSHTASLDKTCDIYNQALTYILKVMFQEFSLSYDENTNTTTNIVEKLIHHTAKNLQPKYEDFNVLFPKYPSYLRRATIASAYGLLGVPTISLGKKNVQKPLTIRKSLRKKHLLLNLSIMISRYFIKGICIIN